MPPNNPRDPRNRMQAMLDALPPIDLTKVTFVVQNFAHYPDDNLPTGYQISVTATVTSTGATFDFNQIVPLSVGDGKTQEEIVQWLWAQPETQLRARQMAAKYQAGMEAIAARGGQPVPLPAGDVVGKAFVPEANA